MISWYRWASHNIRRRLKPDRTVSIPFGGGQIEGPIGHDVINLITYVHGGYYDYDAMRSIEVLLSEGQTFIDVGANIGPYSLLAGSLIGASGRIIAIEPSEDQLEFLRRNLARVAPRNWILTTPLADRERTLAFVDEGYTTQHLADTSVSDIARRTSTLDAELTRIGLDTVGSFAKIDVEGWDSAVILGAQRWLISKPQGLLMEANALSQRSPVPWAQAVSLLHGRGFEFIWPEFSAGRFHTFEQPPPISPFGNYLVLRSKEVQKLEQAVRAPS
jgi:FkbM family methyltransferase